MSNKVTKREMNACAWLNSWKSQCDLQPFQVHHMTPSASAQYLSDIRNLGFLKDDYIDIDESKLPAVDYTGVSEWLLPVPKPRYTYVQYDDGVFHRTIDRNYETCQTHVVENTNYHRFNRKVIVTVNRNHLHKFNVITKENHYHHFNTDLVYKVQDLHKNRVETLRVTGVSASDYKNTVFIEQPKRFIRVEDPNVLNIKTGRPDQSRSKLLRSFMAQSLQMLSPEPKSSSETTQSSQSSINSIGDLPKNLEESLTNLPVASSSPRDSKPKRASKEERARQRTKRQALRRQTFPVGQQVLIEVKIRKTMEI